MGLKKQEAPQKYLWNMLPYDKQRKKINDDNIENVSTYKMFPANTIVNNNEEYFNTLKKFVSEQCAVNVIDYSWTTSPISSRAEIPYIILKERRPWKNNTVAKLVYSLSITKEYITGLLKKISEGGVVASNSIKQVIKSSLKMCGVSEQEQAKFLAGLTNTASVVTGAVSDAASSAASSITQTAQEKYNSVMGITDYEQQIKDIDAKIAAAGNHSATKNKLIEQKKTLQTKMNGTSEIDDILRKSKDVMVEFIDKIKDPQILKDIELCNAVMGLKGTTQAYKNLYLCLNTGFEYRLPYFENAMRDVNNTWAEQNKGILGLTDIAGAMHGVNQILAGYELLFNTDAQGFYFEQAKPFNYPENGEIIHIKFPLINTNSWNDVVDNWHFIFLLLYQNQPTRNDISIIDPPVIYSAKIPNMRYIPYAYISSLKIEYKGVRRRMKIPILKNSKPQEIETIIPDAWDVDITLTGLTSEPSNFNVLNDSIISIKKEAK